MADGMIQKTEGLSRRSRAFDRHAAQRHALFCHPYPVLCFLSVFCPLSSVLCHAEELPDPTRPPAMIAMPSAGLVQAQPEGLQSIIISKTRRAAIIDGETVELKGKHGDARLIEVNEGNVVLQNAQGRQVLTLFPEVQMAVRKSTAVSTKPRAGKSKGKKGTAAGEEKK